MASLLKILQRQHSLFRTQSSSTDSRNLTTIHPLLKCAIRSRSRLSDRRRHPSESGFSTTELMIAVSLVALLATLSAPHLGRWLSVVKVNAAARNLASEMQLGRMRAISENTRYRLTFDIASETYQLHRDNAGEWQVVDSIQPLPNGIDLETATTNPIFFQTLGTVAAGSTITLRNAQNQRRRITVSRSGRVHIKRVP